MPNDPTRRTPSERRPKSISQQLRSKKLAKTGAFNPPPTDDGPHYRALHDVLKSFVGTPHERFVWDIYFDWSRIHDRDRATVTEAATEAGLSFSEYVSRETLNQIRYRLREAGLTEHGRTNSPDNENHKATANVPATPFSDAENRFAELIGVIGDFELHVGERAASRPASWTAEKSATHVRELFAKIDSLLNSCAKSLEPIKQFLIGPVEVGQWKRASWCELTLSVANTIPAVGWKLTNAAVWSGPNDLDERENDDELVIAIGRCRETLQPCPWEDLEREVALELRRAAERLRTNPDVVPRRLPNAIPSPKSAVGRGQSSGKPAWAIRLHDLKREFLQAAKSSRLQIVLVQSANGQDVSDLQPTVDDPLRFAIARQDVSHPNGTPAWRFTYELGQPNDPAKRLMKRGDDILKAHGEEILGLFGLHFIDSRKNWAWLLWQLKNIEHPYQGDIEAESTMAGVLSPDESRQAFAWALGCGPNPDWYAERSRSFRVDLPHPVAASIAAIRAILDRVEAVPKSKSNEASGINAEKGQPLHKAVPVTNKPTRSKRRRRSSGQTRSLTVKQTEALKLHGECEGNIAEVARRMGIDRSTAKQHVDEAFGKLGKRVPTKSKTTSLKMDRRGQLDVTNADDHRG